MKRLAALCAVAGLSLLAGCATDDGYYGGGYGYDGGYGAYGYDGGYSPYAYGYGPGYVPYYDDFGYPYAYGPTLGLGFNYYDYGGSRGGYRNRGGDRNWTRGGGAGGRNWAGRGGMGRPSNPSNVGPQG